MSAISKNGWLEGGCSGAVGQFVFGVASLMKVMNSFMNNRSHDQKCHKHVVIGLGRRSGEASFTVRIPG